MPSYLASCHCGAVEFEREADPSDPVRCNCSLCIRRNAVMSYVEMDPFRLVRGKESLAYVGSLPGVDPYALSPRLIDGACFWRT